MKKILIIIPILAVVALVSWFYVDNVPTRMIPYPYSFNQEQLIIPPQVNKSSILIVGDRMGESLKVFIPDLKEQIFGNTNSPFSIYNWAKDGEGLHRTIRKLKSLKKYPQLIIYFGSTQEYHEKKFNLKEREKILTNYDRYKNPLLLTSILVFPPLSKFIYTPEKRVLLTGEIKRQKLDLNSSEFINYNQLEFRTFKYELAELFQLALDKKFSLLVIVPPVNIQIPILNNCLSILTDEEKKTIKQIETLIKNQNYQDAYTEALILFDKNKENGRIQQLLGESLIGLGKKEEGIQKLEMATAYDCDLWRGGYVMNSILRTELKSHGIPYVDFDQYLLKYFGKNVLFFDSIFPQRIYYDRFIKQISEKIQLILKL